MDGQLAFPEVRPPVRLQKLPLDTLRKCREVAKKQGWSLVRWDDFRDEAKAWLTPAATDEEDARFENVVRGHFKVETF